MVAAVNSYSRPEWADTSFAGGPRPPVPNRLILESPEWGDTDHASSPTPSHCVGPAGLKKLSCSREPAVADRQQRVYRPAGPSDSGENRAPTMIESRTEGFHQVTEASKLRSIFLFRFLLGLLDLNLSSIDRSGCQHSELYPFVLYGFGGHAATRWHTRTKGQSPRQRTYVLRRETVKQRSPGSPRRHRTLGSTSGQCSVRPRQRR
jgi:hypothetical protein